MNVIATTPQSSNRVREEFFQFLQESSFPLVDRNRKALDTLCRENDADAVVVWKAAGPELYVENEKFFFHPSMAKVRISGYRKRGIADPMAEACNIGKNDSFLDCTLGLGADAIVASYFSCGGQITGLEASLPVAMVVKWGMKLYQSQMEWLDTAIKKIEVIAADHRIYLREATDKSYDIVYFDPMFRQPLYKSQSLSPLRHLANPEPLDMESVQEACRVAKKRVVIKERQGSEEFKRLNCDRVYGSPHNNVSFGIIEVK